MTWVVLLAGALLAGVAAAGVLRPFGRGRALTLERLADPLDDERASLLGALRELEEERATGGLEEATYRALRLETEARAVAVLRALDARDGAGRVASELRALRAEPPAATMAPGADGRSDGKANSGGRRSRSSLVAMAAITAVAVGLVALLLSAALQKRSAGQPITGGVGAGSTRTALAFFEQRVADHPRDVAARLDLGEQYMESGNVQGAIAQYLAALSIDPRSPEAHAELGLLIYRAGRAEDGLRAVEQALAVQPNYPQALYYKGVILLRGLNRPADAALAFRAYLRWAPFGALRAQVTGLLREAQTSG